MIIFDSYYKFTKQTTPFHRRQNRMLAAIQTYGSKTECFISNPPLKLFLPQLSPSQQMPLPAHQLTKTLEPHRTPSVIYSIAKHQQILSTLLSNSVQSLWWGFWVTVITLWITAFTFSLVNLLSLTPSSPCSPRSSQWSHKRLVRSDPPGFTPTNE